MHQVTAYIPDNDETLYRTEKGARRHELIELMNEATGSMPSIHLTTNKDLACFLADMLMSQTYQSVADRLLEAVDYFREHRGVLRGPGPSR